MSTNKSVAPIVNVKIQRHTAFDTFVTQVDKRAKNSSGLAIHPNAEIMDVSHHHNIGGPLHKSKYYLEYERQLKERGKGDPILEQNRKKKVEVQKELEQRLRTYQRKASKGRYDIYTDIEVVDVPPDPIRMAQFRYLMAVGDALPCRLFDNDDE